MPTLAAKLFQLLDLSVGGAVLMNRRAGAAALGIARTAVWRTIDREACRNIIEEKRGAKQKKN